MPEYPPIVLDMNADKIVPMKKAAITIRPQKTNPMIAMNFAHLAASPR
jgi:hypothetical protein